MSATDTTIRIYVTMQGDQEVRRRIVETSRTVDEFGRSVTTIRESVSGTAVQMQRFSNVVSSINNMIVQMSITSFVFLLTMRQINSTQRQLATAQENAAEAIRKYGRNSIQARQALRRLAQAQENVRMAQIGFVVQTIATIGSIATLVMRIPELLTALGSLAASYSAVAASATAAKIAMGPVGWALLGLGAGVAVTVGGIYLAGGLGGGEAEFDRQWSEAGRYVKQRAFRESRRYG